jgi:hypothetical protein
VIGQPRGVKFEGVLGERAEHGRATMGGTGNGVKWRGVAVVL